MALNRGLDPFGDGSLKFSWTWDDDGVDTVNSEQDANNEFGVIDNIVDDSAPNGQKSQFGSGTRNSTVPHGFNIGDDFSLCFHARIRDLDEKCLVNVGDVFAEASVGIGWYNGAIGGFFGGTYYNFGDETETGYHHFALTYDGANVSWYRDNVKLHTHAADVDTDPNQPISMYQGATDCWLSDITVFDRILTDSERQILTDDNFSSSEDNVAKPLSILTVITLEEPTYHWNRMGRSVSDPFGDGSLKVSWTFTDNVFKDKTIGCQQDADTTNNLGILSDVTDTNSAPNGLNYLKGSGYVNHLTDLAIPFTGHVDATLCFWLFHPDGGEDTWVDVILGERGEAGSAGSGATVNGGNPYLLLANNDQNTIAGNLTYDWHHHTVSVNAATNKLSLHIDSEHVKTIDFTPNFDNTKKLQVHFDKTYIGVTDILIFDRLLDTSEMDQIIKDDFGVPIAVYPDEAVGTLVAPFYRTLIYPDGIDLTSTIFQGRCIDIFPPSQMLQLEFLPIFTIIVKPQTLSLNLSIKYLPTFSAYNQLNYNKLKTIDPNWSKNYAALYEKYKDIDPSWFVCYKGLYNKRTQLLADYNKSYKALYNKRIQFLVGYVSNRKLVYSKRAQFLVDYVSNRKLLYNKHWYKIVEQNLSYQVGLSFATIGLKYNILRDRPYISTSYETELPDFPEYLDGNLQFWEPQQLPYLGTGGSKIEEGSFTQACETKFDKLAYSFKDIPNQDILHNGPANLDDFIIDRDLVYQKHGNVAILKVTESYYCYVVQGSSSYGEILFKPGPLTISYPRVGSPELNFVMNFPSNREFNIESITQLYICRHENIPGDWPTVNSNAIPDFSFVDSSTGGSGTGSVSVDPDDLVLVSDMFTVIQGGENIYYLAKIGFFHFETKPTSVIKVAPVISFAAAVNGDVTTEVTLVGISYNPGTWTLDGSEVVINSETILFSTSARINRVQPRLVKTYDISLAIPTTNSETQINLNRGEYKLSGYIIVNGVDKWATLTWTGINVYKINSLSTIVDLSKLATRELIVNKLFNKYL